MCKYKCRINKIYLNPKKWNIKKCNQSIVIIRDSIVLLEFTVYKEFFGYQGIEKNKL